MKSRHQICRQLLNSRLWQPEIKVVSNAILVTVVSIIM